MPALHTSARPEHVASEAQPQLASSQLPSHRPSAVHVSERMHASGWVQLCPVCATANVAKVKYYPTLTREKVARIERDYRAAIGGDDAIWEDMMDRKCGFLVWLADVQPIRPVRIEKRDWRAWVVLTPEKNFGLLK